MDLTKLPKYVLFKIALEYDLPQILNLCLTSKKINQSICLNQRFWVSKLFLDFPFIKNADIPSNFIFTDGNINFKSYYLYLNNTNEKYKNNGYLFLFKIIKS